MAEATNRYAVVTGANKGIGFEICKQLASNGIVVLLTARDEKRGLEAVQKLKDCGLSDYLLFHQLDVADQASVDSLRDFVKAHFGKLDILVNNAGVVGAYIEEHLGGEALLGFVCGKEGALNHWREISKETPQLAEECLNINYYGAKRMVEALAPLLQLSDSPRIVNVSSGMGKLKNIQNEWALRVLSDVENLTEKRVDEVLREFLKDFKEDSLETNGWPTFLSAYTLSKAAMNAYTRILAKKYPSFCINCVCPGFVKTDINYNVGTRSVEEGADYVVRLALLPSGGGPSGCFFTQKEKAPF